MQQYLKKNQNQLLVSLDFIQDQTPSHQWMQKFDNFVWLPLWCELDFPFAIFLRIENLLSIYYYFGLTKN